LEVGQRERKRKSVGGNSEGGVGEIKGGKRMGERQSLWHNAIAIGVVGGILVGAIGTLMRQFLVYFVPSFWLYSSVDLVVHTLTALCVGFGLKGMAGRFWLLSGLVMGTATVATMVLFPISAHSLPPFNWSVLTVFPGSLAGMALREGR